MTVEQTGIHCHVGLGGDYLLKVSRGAHKAIPGPVVVLESCRTDLKTSLTCSLRPHGAGQMLLGSKLMRMSVYVSWVSGGRWSVLQV